MRRRHRPPIPHIQPNGFVEWYRSEPRLAFNRTVVTRYTKFLEMRQLAPGTINLRLGAVRRLAYEVNVKRVTVILSLVPVGAKPD
jgi:hypothetical protein